MVLRPTQTKPITASALDQRGNPIANASGYSYTSSNTSIATVTAAGVVTGVANGTVTVTTSLTLNGVTKGAETSVRVTDQAAPGLATVVANATSDTFSPQVVEVAIGGMVTWQFLSVVHNVTFDGGTGAPTRIPDTANASVSRTFPAEGSYDYQCTLHAGMSGTVIVR
jgi:plastocyanin